MIIQLLTHYTKPILKSLIMTNFLPRRVKCGGTEEEIVVAHSCRKRKKANMWYGRGNSGGSWPPAFLRMH